MKSQIIRKKTKSVPARSSVVFIWTVVNEIGDMLDIKFEAFEAVNGWDTKAWVDDKMIDKYIFADIVEVENGLETFCRMEPWTWDK